MATYVNNLRLTELATGEGSGTWGTTTNTNLELIGEALGYGSEAIANASTHTITVADGTADSARSFYLKLTGGGQACTVTLAPNTLSKVWMVENTTNSTLTFSQGSGANVAVPAGQVKMIATDGAGSGAVVYDLLVDTDLTGTTTVVNLTASGTVDAAAVEFDSLSGTGAVAVTDILDQDNMSSNSATALATQQSIKAYVDSSVASFDTLAEVLAQGNTTGSTDIEVTTAQKVQFRDSAIYINSSADGQLDLVADTEIQIAATTIDINGAINASGEIIAASLDISGDIDVDGTTNLDVVDIDGALTGTTATLVGANTLTLRNDTATDADEPKLIFDNDAFAGANYANIRTGNGGLQLYLESPSTSTFQNRHRLLFNGGGSDDFQYLLSTDNGSNYVNYFQIDGGNVTFNETGADRDFRVESDANTHALFVDAGNGRVGLFTSSPAAPLDIQFGDNANILRGSYASGEDNFFLELDSAIVASGVVGYQFHLTNNGTAYNNTLTLDRGNVGIGVESADEILHVEKSTGTTLVKTEVGGNSTVGFEIAKTGATTKNWRIADGQVANGSLDIYDVTNSRSILHADTQEVVINDTAVNLDFRVESDNLSHMLFVDAGADGVGIGDGSVQANGLRISSSTGTTNAVDTKLYLNARSSGTTTTGFGPGIVFAGDRNGDGNTQQMARISAVAEVNSGTTLSSGLQFQTATSGVNSAKMTINNLGSVGIGVADGDVTSDGTAARTYVGIIGTANRGRLNIGSTASNGADSGVISFVNGANEIGNINMETNSGSQTVGKMYISSTDILDVRAAGGVIFNEDSADVDFRVESNGNANMIRVDGGNNRVGIGESTPTKTLSVLGDAIIKNTLDGTYLTLHSTQANNASGPDIVLFRDSSSPADDDPLSTIFYQGRNSAGAIKDYMKVRSYIKDVTDGTEDFGMDIQVMTAGNAVNALDILPSELVINNASVDRDFRVESNGNANMLFVDANNNRVGIGTGAPSYEFVVSKDGSSGIELGPQGINTTTSLVQFYNRSTAAYDTARFYASGYDYYVGSVTNVLSLTSGGVIANEGGSASLDFRVESDNNTHMLFVDSGEDIVSMGMPAGVPSWIGGNSVVVADNLYAFQGASYSNACFNLSVDNNFTYLLHNAYYGSGWKQRLTGYAPTMLQTGSAAYNFNYAADTGSDASISWISLMALNSSGAIFNDAGNAGQDFRVESDSDTHMLFVDSGNNAVCMGTATQQATLTVSENQASHFVGHFTNSNANAYGVAIDTGSGSQLFFYLGGANKGSIISNSSGTAYNTSSDQRLKENIADADDAGSKIDSIQVRKFDWKADGSHQDYGMVAQELQIVAPEAVSALEDPDEMMGVDYSKLVPMLVKEIQTLRARVADLES